MDANILNTVMRDHWVSRGHRYVLPNAFFQSYECDVFSITTSKLIYECEIKISRQDFFNDFKKTSFKGNKHDNLKAGEGLCNRFYFVVPDGLVKPEEVPPHCGLLYVRACNDKRGYEVGVAKEAPMLKKTKAPDWIYKQMVDKCYFRYLHMLAENKRLYARIKKLKAE